MEEIDAIDNGVDVCSSGTPNYIVSTTLSNRVGRKDIIIMKSLIVEKSAEGGFARRQVCALFSGATDEKLPGSQDKMPALRAKDRGYVKFPAKTRIYCIFFYLMMHTKTNIYSENR